MIVTGREFWDRGYGSALISVIPPGAPLLPGSKMQASSLGKAPGIRYPGGWAGYNWRKHAATLADIEKWTADGASFGLRADEFPGLDIDCMDPELADQIEALAFLTFGTTWVRYGRRPKRLLMYRQHQGQPITRMRLWLEREGASHLVELLGVGQQYLVAGTHPVTEKPYEWSEEIPADFALLPIRREAVDALFEGIRGIFEPRGWTIHREGDGHERSDAAADQAGLRAPSMSALGDLIEMLPNDDTAYPGRDAYIRMGIAIRAAAGDDVEGGYEVFASWAARHARDERVTGNPETWRRDYDRMRGPFVIGWPWLVDQGRRFGRSTAAEDFTRVDPSEAPAPQAAAPEPVTAGLLANGDDPGHSTAEWLEHPEYMELGPPVVPRFGWAGMKTIFSGREKRGKTTLLRAALAAVSSGHEFLGETTEPRRVVWLTEEPIQLAIGHLVKLPHNKDEFFTVSMGKDPRAQLASAVGRWVRRGDVVVIDTLYRYAPVQNENDASEWRPYFMDFDVISKRGAALIVVVHATKGREDGAYRGSSAIGAWFDVIIEMEDPGRESTTRRLLCRSRIAGDDFSVVYDGHGGFRLLTKDQQAVRAEDARVREVVENLRNGMYRGRIKSSTLYTLREAARQGLVVEEVAGWRVLTEEERARRDFQ